ncbi:hypothetical protein Vretimale_1047 [Volvox reticuliferus]|uniref:VHS domain-containing protein n=1 Tax=Volvox reticuliferus TaxID=1737510 RepID=A0A8J4CK99_9CHLO|nr:hypothetical protein Vretifemale_10389 [Volvox reticuliferus]GIL94945.1 hypothetical protein Vretimale_1047 [Volvox reticuliferus]
MSSLFAGLKEKFADKLAEFKGSTAPQDPHDTHAAELVEAATSDELIAPDWNLNLNVVDFVNNDVHQNSARIFKAVKRSLAKPNTKVQLLSLTLLEACVKNCPVELHTQLASSELWADVVRFAEDSSITRVDAEVRDKVLRMVEDFSSVLQPPQFQAAYESLLDRGVDFPVRSPDESVPILTPPASVAAAGMLAAAPAVAPTAEGAPAAAAARDVAGSEPDADPLEGLADEDRAAIQAALAELEAEARAAQEAARVAAEADAEERRQHQHQHQQHQQQAAVETEAALSLLAAATAGETAAGAAAIATPMGVAAVAGTAGAVAIDMPLPHAQALAMQQQQPPHYPAESLVAGVPPSQPRQGAPADEAQEPHAGTAEERVAALLETANNTTLLLSEMLASVPDSEPLAVREPYVAEVADSCVRLRSRIERHLETLADEALLASALSQHEELTRVLLRYDELLAVAESVAPTVPRNAAAVAMAHSAASWGSAVAVASPGHQPLQQPAELPQDPGAGFGPTGQKVAAVAAALKERFTGAFDKLMAAAASARAPGAQPPSAMAPGTAAGVPIGDGVPPTAVAAGAFTLLDDEDEEPNEGTSLITKRAPQPHMPAAAVTMAATSPQFQPHVQLQQLLLEATAAPAAPAPPPAAAGAAGPDLINFDDVAPQPAPQRPPAAAAQQQPSNPTVAPEAMQQQVGASAAGGGLEDLLSGLTIHTPAVAHDTTAAAATGVTDAGLQVTPQQQLRPQLDSRDGSGDDQLVNALDLLVFQSSANASPEVGTPAAVEPETSTGGELPPSVSHTHL